MHLATCENDMTGLILTWQAAGVAFATVLVKQPAPQCATVTRHLWSPGGVMPVSPILRIQLSQRSGSTRLSCGSQMSAQTLCQARSTCRGQLQKPRSCFGGGSSSSNADRTRDTAMLWPEQCGFMP